MSEPAKPDREADGLFEIVRQRYGDRLTPELMEELRKIVRAQVEAARALRPVRLTNADEPMQRFAPYREEPPLTFDPLTFDPLTFDPLTLPSPQRGEGDAP
ncbi:MAG: hypothetical protein HYR50_13380 [Candidatus Rokubacteria bacterium]|nr:hypothetical protein [Candidatus Rokubacteria bacterium]